MRSKHRASLAVLAVAAAAGIGGAVTVAVGGGSPEPSALATRGELLSTGAGLGQGLALDGSRLVASEAGAQRELAELGGGEEVIAALTGALVPVATASADGSLIVYSTWRQLAVLDYDAPGLGLEVGDPVGVPSVRAYDREKGVDALLAGGAYAPAVSKAGAIAYAVGDEETVRQNVDYTSRVVVRNSLEGEPREWTSKSARYFPYAWVDDSLLVYQALQDSEATDLYVYRGPDDATLLAPEAYVIAVSPDGSRVLASVGRRMLEVLRVADGAIESSLALDGGAVAVDSPTTPHALMYSGSWRGDRIVASSDLGLVVLNVEEGLRIESILATPDYPHGIIEPVLVDDTHVNGWADLPDPKPVGKGTSEPAYDNALVTCDLVERTCATGEPNPAREWARWIANPSR